MNLTPDETKKLAADAVIAELPESGIVGLGTGSTARFFVEAVGDLVRHHGRQLACVCTSEAIRTHATALGIPLLSDDGPWTIDVTVDGADEVDDALNLSKGGGGALTREKIVSHASRRTVIICDSTKRVHHLGETRPIAIEVLTFAHATTAQHLAKLGRPQLRVDRGGGGGGALARTDGGNVLVDLHVDPMSITDPRALDQAIRSIPGVVETGIFVDRADLVLVAHADGRVERLVRSR